MKGQTALALAIHHQRWQLSIAKLEKALSRLEEVVNTQEANPLLTDATIQRFENCIELF